MEFERDALLHLLKLAGILNSAPQEIRPQPSPVPLYVSEYEEDMQWQADHSMIPKDELEDILRELDFENAAVYSDDQNDRQSLTY